MSDSSPETAPSSNSSDSSSSNSSNNSSSSDSSSSSSPPSSDSSSSSSSSPAKSESPPSSPPPSSPPPSSPPPSSPPPSSPPPSSDNSSSSSSPPKSDSPPPSSDDSPSPSPPNSSSQSPQTQSPPHNGDGSGSGSDSSPSPPGNKPGSQPSQGFTPPAPLNSQSPPAPHRLDPPPHSGPGRGTPGNSDNAPPPSDNSGSGSNDNTVAIVAGVAVAGIFVLALIILCIWCCRRKKQKQQRYYMGPGRPPKGGEQYYKSNSQWNNRQPMDHVMKVPQGEMGTTQGGWVPPTAHQGASSSSEFGSGYSGQVGQGPLPPQSPNMGGLGGFSQSQFSYEELAKATDGFSQANLLGQGGFGYVHKGVLNDGRVVAIKSLKSGSGQGEREFQAEVEIISRVHHRHLVSLVGYCIANGQRMLVYEFVANSTLEFHLHGKGRPVMDWETRLKIALGSAKGLAYLHEDCQHRIIHRDIKAANILLDENYEALVADFGLAKLTSDNNTHVSTRVMGTFGYLAPEYASSGKLTEKSDVFSFGVMLLELITGRRPVDPNDKYMEDSLVDWARPLLTRGLEEGVFDGLVDVRLEGNYDPDELKRMIACAAASIRHSAKRRPKMSQIVRTLEGNSSLEDLNDAARPGKTQSFASNTGNPNAYDTAMYNADMVKFRKMVMTTGEFSSSGEQGAPSE